MGSLLVVAGGMIGNQTTPFFTELVKLQANTFSGSDASAEDEDCIKSHLDLCLYLVSQEEIPSNDIAVDVLMVRFYLNRNH